MPKFAANLSMMFNEVDFLDRFDAAAEAGFSGVEYLFPYAWDKAELAERLSQAGLTQVLFNMPPGDWEAGERGMAILPGRVADFRAGVETAIDYAKALGCGQLHCMAGLVPDNADPAALRRTYVENLRYAAEKAGGAGIRVLIEAINTRDMPGFYLNTSRQALEIIDEVGSDNLFFQYDIYHMQIMEGDLAPTLEACLDKIAHLQLADTPGRHEPGTGEINYPFLFEHLDRIGYDGWIGCEYKPATTTAEGLGWFAPYKNDGQAAA
ncbi:MAG: hydroxypyruvate isomerase [Kiloniellales bacterium]|nr:hydroxypyruvate isomerase [Kiloniellales bacterium]